MQRLTTAIVLLMAMTLTAGAAERKFERTFSVQPGGLLTVKLDAGSVDVKGTSGREVKIAGKLEGDRDAVEEYLLEADRKGEGVEVTGRMKKRRMWNLWGRDDLTVHVVIEVPRSYTLRLETAGGNLRVTEIEGRVDGSTSGGNIEGQDITGDVNVETSGGNLTFERVTGRLDGETSGGNIIVRGVEGAVRVETSGGNVSVAGIDGAVRARTSGGNVRAEIRENRGVDLRTSGGDIILSLPAATGAWLDASSSGGSVTCDLPVTIEGKPDESRVRGTINGGGETILARTSGGDIEIRPAK